jgi:hypothetical protein
MPLCPYLAGSSEPGVAAATLLSLPPIAISSLPSSPVDSPTRNHYKSIVRAFFTARYKGDESDG